jgi:hypothetical protein
MTCTKRLVTLSLGFILAGIASASAQTRVMAVGDSLTDGNFYRARFVARAGADNASVAMVGPKSDAFGGHAGFSGRSIAPFNNPNQTSTINGQTVNTSMSGMLTNYNPDVVLLMIGTNDMRHGLGAGQGNPPNYPSNGTNVIGAEYASPLNGSYLNGLGSHFNSPTYGTTHLKGNISTLVNTVLDSTATRKLVMAKIPPLGNGGAGSATDPYPADKPTRTIKEFNDNAVERIKEFNAYIDDVYAALPADKKSRMRVVDNFTNVDRSYQTSVSPLNDFGTAERQAGDWVHPQLGAPAWTLMGDQMYSGYTQVVPEPTSLGFLAVGSFVALRRRRAA